MKIYEYKLKIRNYILLFEFCYDWLKTHDLYRSQIAHVFCIFIFKKCLIFEFVTFYLYFEMFQMKDALHL